MRIVVALKAVPDLVEELELTDDETDIDREYLKYVVSEWDEQALEEALLVKEAGDAEVVAVALADDPDIEQSLYTALAKGADQAVLLEGGSGSSTRARAAAFAAYLTQQPADLVLTGVQSVDDLDGQLPSALAGALGQPHVSVVASVSVDGDAVTVRQEYSGGLAADLRVTLPAVIGVQAARQSPRYAPITKIRQMQQAGGLETVAVSPEAADNGLEVRRMRVPEAAGHAEMLEGDPDDVAEKIVELLRSRGLVKG
jgi:electron transfer flavoprotein beta subunit